MIYIGSRKNIEKMRGLTVARSRHKGGRRSTIIRGGLKGYSKTSAQRASWLPPRKLKR